MIFSHFSVCLSLPSAETLDLCGPESLFGNGKLLLVCLKALVLGSAFGDDPEAQYLFPCFSLLFFFVVVGFSANNYVVFMYWEEMSDIWNFNVKHQTRV